MSYTNSLEAVVKNWLDGFLWFEIDLVLLGDGTVLAAHEGHEQFLGLASGRAFDQVGLSEIVLRDESKRLTYLTLDDLLDLAADLGVRLILDVKTHHREVYRALSDMAAARGMLSNVVPQVYGESTLEMVRDLKFPKHLFTWWGLDGSARERVAFCREYSVQTAWLRSDWATPSALALLADAGVTHIGVHWDMHRPKCMDFLSRGISVMNDCTYIGQQESQESYESASRYLHALYLLFLNRVPDSEGLRAKTECLIAGQASRADLRDEILQSAEYRQRL